MSFLGDHICCDDWREETRKEGEMFQFDNNEAKHACNVGWGAFWEKKNSDHVQRIAKIWKFRGGGLQKLKL